MASIIRASMVNPFLALATGISGRLGLPYTTVSAAPSSYQIAGGSLLERIGAARIHSPFILTLNPSFPNVTDGYPRRPPIQCMSGPVGNGGRDPSAAISSSPASGIARAGTRGAPWSGTYAVLSRHEVVYEPSAQDKLAMTSYVALWQGLPPDVYQKSLSSGGLRALRYDYKNGYIWVNPEAVEAFEKNGSEQYFSVNVFKEGKREQVIVSPPHHPDPGREAAHLETINDEFRREQLKRRGKGAGSGIKAQVIAGRIDLR